MYEVEVAYRQFPGEAVEFIPESQAGEEHKHFCVLSVRFHIAEIYPPEPDVGEGIDWVGHIDTIHMRIDGFPRANRLRDEAFVAAKTFLLTHHEDAVWEACGEYAESLYLNEEAA
jgi:hypothetical protein